MNDEDIVNLYFEIEKLERRFSAKLKQTHSFSGQYRCLLLLLYNGDMKQTQLAAYMNVRSASLSELLGKLTAKGLIKREPSTHDKRTFQVSLTSAGIKLAQEYDLSRAKSHHIMVSRLSAEEKEQFYYLLKKIKQGYMEENEND